MKHLFYTMFAIFIITISANTQAQQTPGEYMKGITENFQKINKDYWDYTSSVAHSKNAKKTENRRKELINTVTEVINNVSRTPGYNGDKSLRDSVLSYFKLAKNVLKEDYAKIVDMEAIAEQSYDLMEAYILAQEIANDKLDKAGDMVNAEQKKFAATYNIKLIDTKTDVEKKLEKANVVFGYYNTVYLIFFKSYKQDFYLTEAYKKKDINAIEQNKNALIEFSSVGLAKLDTLKPFKNDVSLLNAGKKVIACLKKYAEKTPEIVDFMMKEEKMNKLKATIDAKQPSARTQEEIDQFNAAVVDFNKSVTDYNNLNQQMFKEKNTAIENWNNVVQYFFDKHVPKNK